MGSRRWRSAERCLGVYAGVVTLGLAGVLFSGAASNGHNRFDEITVHRINVVEPDGTVRMVISNQASAPGIFLRNKEYPHPSRASAGMLFYDNEGTEDGGLIYGLDKDVTGRVAGSNVHMSFDKRNQDQMFTVDTGTEDGKDYSRLTMQDRGDYPITDAMAANDRISRLPEAQRTAAWQEFRASHPGDHSRVVLGRAEDGASELRLKDREGRDRILLRVAPDGEPTVETLDAAGKVVGEVLSTRSR